MSNIQKIRVIKPLRLREDWSYSDKDRITMAIKGRRKYFDTDKITANIVEIIYRTEDDPKTDRSFFMEKEEFVTFLRIL